MQVKDKILISSILFFLLTLLLPWVSWINVLAVIATTVAMLTYNGIKEKKELIRKRTFLIPVVVFFILIGISFFLSANKNAALMGLDPRLPLLYFAASAGTMLIKNEIREKILIGIASIITIISLICFFYGLYRSVSSSDTSYLYNDSLTTPIAGQQSIYIALLVNIAIYIFTWFIFFKPSFSYKWVLAVAIVFLFVFSFLLASRNQMLVLYISTIGFAVYYIFKKRKYLKGATLLLGLIIVSILFLRVFPKTMNRFKELSYTKFNYNQQGAESHYGMAVDSSQWNGINTRLAIWSCGWELFKAHPIIGVGLGDKNDALIKIYRNRGFHFAIQTKKHLHNNYLDILIGLGITGLVIFLLGWIVFPFIQLWQNRDGLSILILITLALAMFTENYLDRSLGGMLVGFFVPFLLSDKPNKRQTGY